ncbi:hypothetical protein G7046_g2889 [Stylonectria norvegica]|nr:hypothetical protein G7046_g2889 [Stylonectria norvegica]
MNQPSRDPKLPRQRHWARARDPDATACYGMRKTHGCGLRLRRDRPGEALGRNPAPHRPSHVARLERFHDDLPRRARDDGVLEAHGGIGDGVKSGPALHRPLCIAELLVTDPTSWHLIDVDASKLRQSTNTHLDSRHSTRQAFPKPPRPSRNLLYRPPGSTEAARSSGLAAMAGAARICNTLLS